MAKLNKGVREVSYVNTTITLCIREDAYSSADTSQRVHAANDNEEAIEDHCYEETQINEYETDKGITSVEILNAPNTQRGNASNTQKGSTQNCKKTCNLKVILIIILIIFAVTALSATLGVILMSKTQEPTICASTTSTTSTSATTTSPTTTAPTSGPTTTSLPKCLEKWISFQQSCYLFVENLLNVNRAEDKCKSLNSHLVYVENLKEFLFLRDYVMSYGTDSYWWVGITDVEKEGTWKYVGTDRVANLTDFPIFADNYHGSEHCAAYTFWANFYWNDAPCGSTYNYICEREDY